MNLSLNDLVGSNNSSMMICIFKCRYGGIIGALIAQMNHAEGLEDQFNGGDTRYETVDAPLHNLGWFPAVCVENVDDVMPALAKKIEEINNLNVDKRKWKTCVEWLGALIEKDKHGVLLRDLKQDAPLCDVNTAYEILSEYF